ncbi:hypothetical protein [Nocardia panacis]
MDLLAAASAAVLVAVAFAVPRLAGEEFRRTLYAGSAPIFGIWLPHIGWGTGPAILIAVLVVRYGPEFAARQPWSRLPGLAYVTSLGWTFALAMVDGWQRGFVGRLLDRNEYLREVGGVTDIPAMLRGFSGRILDFQPDSWTTHVSGHPPGALLFFVLLDRVGPGGGAWAGAACMFLGCSVVPAILVALHALGVEHRARAALPYLVLAPAAIWIAVSADAVFAGVTAWALALLARATRESAWGTTAVGAGVLFGLGVYLNYGLILMAIPALILLCARRAVWPLLPMLAGALAVAAVFTMAGFWWLDGYHLVVQRYYQGIASERPFSYWWWGNLAAAVCAVGAAAIGGVPRALSPKMLRALDPAALLVAGCLVAILVADASGLSKAETERIWLPFTVWIIVAAGFLPRRAARAWLAVQAVGALALVHLLLTNW